ncbi:MAG: hypothetical protein WC236_11970 [Gallionellaceae bacterium]|jgi:hypothetical protein
MTEEKKQTNQLADYRKWLVAAEQKSQEDFDKTVLTLSGGALGISFVFLKDVIGPHPIIMSSFLLVAWSAWAFSTFSVLTSYYLSHLALRRAISQVDDGTIYKQPPGGAFACMTAILNAIGAMLFLVGVCCITVFAGANLSIKGTLNDRKETDVSTSTANPSTTTTKVTASDTNAGQTTNNGRIYSPASAPAAAKK